jgi:hypothetical protein
MVGCKNADISGNSDVVADHKPSPVIQSAFLVHHAVMPHHKAPFPLGIKPGIHKDEAALPDAESHHMSIEK